MLVVETIAKIRRAFFVITSVKVVEFGCDLKWPWVMRPVV